MTEVQRNLAAQVEMYGEPLAEVFTRLTSGLGLSQAQLARTVGMSPAMLSQLGSGKRVKIGNPAVQRRLEEVSLLLEDVRAQRVTGDGIPERLDTIRESTGSRTATRHDAPALPGEQPTAQASTVRALLRSVASGAELQAAADLLATDHPRLAEVVRTYGLGAPEEAEEHLRRHRDLF